MWSSCFCCSKSTVSLKECLSTQLSLLGLKRNRGEPTSHHGHEGLSLKAPQQSVNLQGQDTGLPPWLRWHSGCFLAGEEVQSLGGGGFFKSAHKATPPPPPPLPLLTVWNRHSSRSPYATPEKCPASFQHSATPCQSLSCLALRHGAEWSCTTSSFRPTEHIRG